MKKISKKRKEIVKKLDFLKRYDPKEAIKFLKDNSHVKFNETLDVAIKLSIDASKTDQSIRGVIYNISISENFVGYHTSRKLHRPSGTWEDELALAQSGELGYKIKN